MRTLASDILPLATNHLGLSGRKYKRTGARHRGADTAYNIYIITFIVFTLYIYQLKGSALPIEKKILKKENLKTKKNFKTKKIKYFRLKHPPGSPECPQKNSAHSIQPFGRPQGTYIYTNVLFYYIELIFRKKRSCLLTSQEEPQRSESSQNENRIT